MDRLEKLGIKLQPLTRQNSAKILDFMVQSFKDAPLVKKGIQTIDVVRRKSQALFPKLLQAQEELNKKFNRNVQYSAAYTQNGQIVAFIFVCDFPTFLKKTTQIEQDYYYELLRNHNSKIEVGKDVYFGKIVVVQKNQGLGTSILLERFEYLEKFGYKTVWGTGTNPHIVQHNKNIGGYNGTTMDVKLPDGSLHKIPIVVCDIHVGIQGARKKKQKKQITAKL